MVHAPPHWFFFRPPDAFLSATFPTRNLFPFPNVSLTFNMRFARKSLFFALCQLRRSRFSCSCSLLSFRFSCISTSLCVLVVLRSFHPLPPQLLSCVNFFFFFVFVCSFFVWLPAVVSVWDVTHLCIGLT